MRLSWLYFYMNNNCCVLRRKRELCGVGWPSQRAWGAAYLSRACLGWVSVPMASLITSHPAQRWPPGRQDAGGSRLESSRQDSTKLLSALGLPGPVFSIITHIPGNKDARKSHKDNSLPIKLSSKEP